MEKIEKSGITPQSLSLKGEGRAINWSLLWA
jgi:hypothetical protein